MEILQLVFLLTFLAMGIISFRLWRLYRNRPMRGLGWWVCGCCGMALTPLMVLVGPYIGKWSLTVAAHISSIGGFCAVWIGTRMFLGVEERYPNILLFIAFLGSLTFAFYWFWDIHPQYQVRLTINCVFLLLFSMAISQALFTARMRLGAVTVGGVLFMVFALINGFRTINIILFPVGGSLYMSDGFSRLLTVIMLPVLVGALSTLEFLARNFVEEDAESDA